jgi:hypothetical protein
MQTHHRFAPSTLRRGVPLPSPSQESQSAVMQSSVGSEELSDRQAVIAVMVGGGLACEDVALVLSLPLRAVEEDLQRAMRTLGLTDPEDLSDGIIAARHNDAPSTSRADPEHRAKNASREDDRPSGVGSSPVRLAHSSQTTDSHALTDACTGVRPVQPVNSLVLLDATEATQEHTYPRFETVCFLHPSNASYLQAADMLRSAQHEIEQEHLHGNEYVVAVEVWGNETHGVHDYRGQHVDLTGGTHTIYWYRATITQHPETRPTTDPWPKPGKQP